MTTNLNHLVDDEMVLVSSQYFTDIFTQVVPNQGEVKPRWRRRKSKEASLIGLRKRKLSEDQVIMLEKSFENEHKLESERKDKLALELGLDPRQVAVWFQNRRARFKSKKLEENYSKMKKQYVADVVETCRLEAEMLSLRGRLEEAEKEIQRLMVERSSPSINSPNPSSLTVEAMKAQPQFLGEFGMEVLENVLWVHEYNTYANGFEWVNQLQCSIYDM